MNYPLHNLLDDKEFENITVSICEQILGIGTIIFSEVKDGGRDAKFTGTAEHFPSKKDPWKGKFVIQAKHTTKINASCSDSDFKRILRCEVKSKLLPLKQHKMLDYYLLFTNRKLSGVQAAKIESFLDENVGVTNEIIGDERIQKWFNDYPQIAKRHGLDKLLLPLHFYENDLKDIIVAFSEANISSEKISNIENTLSRIKIEKKNELNNLSKEYFDSCFKNSYKEFSKIEVFLKDPINIKYTNYYDVTVKDLQAKISIKRDEYKTFEEIIEYLYDHVLQNNIETLKDKRPLIRIFLHYMYNHCDIGREE